MKKTFLLGLLAAAIMTLTLTSCNPNVDTGTAPTITGALFVTPSDLIDNPVWSTVIERETKNLSLNQNYRLCVKWNDPDLDVVEVGICQDDKFNSYWHWDQLKFDDPQKDMWAIFKFNLSEINGKENYIQNNKPVYVRVTDSKGNYSLIYTINGITVR